MRGLEIFTYFSAGYVCGFSILSGMLLSYLRYLYRHWTAKISEVVFVGVGIANIVVMGAGVIFIIVLFIYKEPDAEAEGVVRVISTGLGILVGMAAAFLAAGLINKAERDRSEKKV